MSYTVWCLHNHLVKCTAPAVLTVLFAISFFLHPSHSYNMQSSSNLKEILFWSYLELLLYFPLPRALRKGHLLTVRSCFLCFLCKPVPGRSLLHHYTEPSPVTIITNFILLNTVANSQPFLSWCHSCSPSSFFFLDSPLFFTCSIGNFTLCFPPPSPVAQSLFLDHILLPDFFLLSI